MALRLSRTLLIVGIALVLSEPAVVQRLEHPGPLADLVTTSAIPAGIVAGSDDRARTGVPAQCNRHTIRSRRATLFCRRSHRTPAKTPVASPNAPGWISGPTAMAMSAEALFGHAALKA